MRILALDLGKRMGVAYGDSMLLGHPGSLFVDAVLIHGTNAEFRARNFGVWLNSMLRGYPSDLIVTEAPMNPAASRSADATIGQLYLHGALQAVTANLDVDVETAPVMAVRKHFCGQATAAPRRTQKRTMAQANADRRAINMMVLHRAILLGYLPGDSLDWDCANACALFDFACAKFARTRPQDLVMFGEGAT